jgi:putative YhbY family RNA-binding protein
MLELSPHERRALRAQAHHLHPVVTIGQHGLTPTVLTEIDLALNAHGLIKVRVFLDGRDEREVLLAEIADGLDAAPVQHIGKLFVLWRPQPEPAPAPAEVPRSKRGKPPSGKPRAAKPKAAHGTERVGRRARGAHTPEPGEHTTARPRTPQREATRGPSAPNPRRRRTARS